MYPKENNMARTFIKDFQPGMTVENEIFHLAEKDLRSSTNGSLYMSLLLSDRTGTVNARLWQATEGLYKSLPQDGFVQVKGRTENYKGVIQFIIDAIRPLDEQTPIHVEDFLPVTDKDIDQMYRRVLEILRSIKNKSLLFLIKQFVEDKPLVERFKKAPAAINMHHAYLGGLLEHTLNVMELAVLLAPRYEEINGDLLITGAFLHDIGKTRELAWDVSLKYTDPGQLLGHLVMGTMMVEEKAAALADIGEPFPTDLLQMLQHMIVSHHGEYEYGAAKLPMTAEALVLHHLDNLDAKMNMVKQQFEEADDGESWTKYVKSLERKFYRAMPNGTTAS
jgi:3'-5' exoribonuclease